MLTGVLYELLNVIWTASLYYHRNCHCHHIINHSGPNSIACLLTLCVYLVFPRFLQGSKTSSSQRFVFRCLFWCCPSPVCIPVNCPFASNPKLQSQYFKHLFVPMSVLGTAGSSKGRNNTQVCCCQSPTVHILNTHALYHISNQLLGAESLRS
jgi:hypothetical protein